MHAKRLGQTNLIVLEKGEELIGTVLAYCTENNIQSAWVNGLGAISKAKLALYHLDRKEYQRTEMNGSFELINLTGNIGLLNDKLVAHLHATISDGNMNSFGGHLDEAVIAATCEILMEEIPVVITRQHSDEIGLNLIKRNS